MRTGIITFQGTGGITSLSAAGCLQRWRHDWLNSPANRLSTVIQACRENTSPQFPPVTGHWLAEPMAHYVSPNRALLTYLPGDQGAGAGAGRTSKLLRIPTSIISPSADTAKPLTSSLSSPCPRLCLTASGTLCTAVGCNWSFAVARTKAGRPLRGPEGATKDKIARS